MRKKLLFLTATIGVAAIAVVTGQSTPANEALWEAARAGDTARITAALGQGANVNAKSRYDVTALIFAAGSGRLDAVKLLVSRGADVNAQDTFYRARAAEMALTNGHADVGLFLVQSGAEADGVLAAAVQFNNAGAGECRRRRQGDAPGPAGRPWHGRGHETRRAPSRHQGGVRQAARRSRGAGVHGRCRDASEVPRHVPRCRERHHDGRDAAGRRR